MLGQPPWRWEGVGSYDFSKIILLLLSPRAKDLNCNIKTHKILTCKQM